MSSPKLPQNQDDGEMTKVGVSCQCHVGVRPQEGEMTKLAHGAHQCQSCGQTWGVTLVKKGGSQSPYKKGGPRSS